jgi:protein O-mannosyl-transferase
LIELNFNPNMSTQQLPEKQAQACESSSVATPGVSVSRWSSLIGTLPSEGWLMRINLLLLFGLYVRSIGFAPVYDDNVMSEWGGRLRDIPQFFAHDIFGSDGTAHSVYYRPLSMTWGYMVSYLTGGAPGWLHLSSIFLHLAVVALAYLFGRHLFRDGRLAVLTAALFGLHPSKVESVAWIGSSCVDGLGAVFFFGSLIAFLKWREIKSTRWLSLSVALFACATFTKETMVFIPILIAFYLWFTTPSVGRISRTLRTLLPYGAVWIVFMAIRHRVIKPPAATAEYVHPTFTLANLWTAPFAIWWYIRHLIMPWGFCVEYGTKVLDRPTLLGFVLPGLGVLLLVAMAWWLWRRQGSSVTAAFLIFWFVLTMAPQVILAPMVSEHDRYLYIPLYAFCALVAWAILYLGRVPAKVRVAAVLSVVALWSGMTWHEMGYWDCDKTLWGRVLEISPSQLKAQLALAGIYSESGDRVKALSILSDGLRYRPTSLKLLMSRAGILHENEQFDESRAEYLKVMQLTEPPAGHSVEAGLPTSSRAFAAYQLALLDLSSNNFVEAENYVRMAISLDFNGVGYHVTLSQSLRGQGRTNEANAENALELQLGMAQLSKAAKRASMRE